MTRLMDRVIRRPVFGESCFAEEFPAKMAPGLGAPFIRVEGGTASFGGFASVLADTDDTGIEGVTPLLFRSADLALERAKRRAQRPLGVEPAGLRRGDDR